MPDDCFKKLGDQFSHAKPAAENISARVPKDKVLQTKYGAVTADTGFQNKMSVARRYKAWTEANRIKWIPKGNNPVLYEKSFLNTLLPEDFSGMKVVVDPLSPEAILTGTPVYEAELAKRFGITKGHALYEAEVAGKRITDAVSAHGLRVDTSIFQEQLSFAQKEMGSLEKKIHSELGQFRINSNEELGAKLVERGHKPPRTFKGNIEVSADVLQEAAKTDPVFADVVEFKHKQRNAGVLKRLMSETRDGRIHTTYDQLKTPTGRIQSEAPNMKNLTPELRKGILADPGKVFLEADYAQEEMRIIAGQADIKVWKDAFKAGIDTHTATASEMFGVPVEAVTPDMRKAAKVINLGQMYGQTPYAVGQQLGVTEERAVELMKKFHEAAPELKKFAAQIGKQAMKDGFVTTAQGRVRDLAREIEVDFDKAMRQAVNMRGQGGAADLLKSVMKDLEPLGKQGIEMAHFIDDAILFQVPEGMNLETAQAMIREKMEKVLNGVKMKVEFKTGKSFGGLVASDKLVLEGSKPIAATKPVQSGAREFAAKFKSEQELKVSKFGGDLKAHTNPVSMVKTDGGTYIKKLVADSEITAEELYYDVSQELGSTVVPPAGRIGKDKMVSELTPGKDMTTLMSEHRGKKSFGPLQQAVTKYVETSREGSDFVFMDHIFNQIDRNTGNILFQYNAEKNVVEGMKLVDNGSALVPEMAHTNQAIYSALRGETFKLHGESIEGIKTWLKRFGWDEAIMPGTVDHTVMWNSMGAKFDTFLDRYVWDPSAENWGSRSAVKEVMWRIQNVVDSNFELPVSTWAKAPVRRTKL